MNPEELRTLSTLDSKEVVREALRVAADLIEELLEYVEHHAGCMNRYKEDGNCDCGLKKLTGES